MSGLPMHYGKVQSMGSLADVTDYKSDVTVSNVVIVVWFSTSSLANALNAVVCTWVYTLASQLNYGYDFESYVANKGIVRHPRITSPRTHSDNPVNESLDDDVMCDIPVYG